MANRMGCSSRLIFNRTHDGKLFYLKVIQFSACFDHDRYVTFNRTGGVNKQRGERKFFRN